MLKKGEYAKTQVEVVLEQKELFSQRVCEQLSRKKKEKPKTASLSTCLENYL